MSATATTKTRKWLKVKDFEGLPKREDFEIVQEELPPLKDDEFLVEGQWWTVDPYMRSTKVGIQLGQPMIGGQVAKVIESRNKDYNVGDLVTGFLGWVTHSICTSKGMHKLDPSSPMSPSTALGILGMPGATAYFGLLNVCNPKAGETLLVNTAAGAVGSAVGQIGKIKGMRVVGFTGSDEKVSYLKSLGSFDAVYNYKTIPSLSDAIKEGCPNGVDVFFDNVGGEFFETTLNHMNPFGRISLCGAISEYNETETRKEKSVTIPIIIKQLNIEGFVVTRWLTDWPVAFKKMGQWIKEGKLQYRETVFEGFESMYDAFLSLFTGTNIGKVVVKV